jgi:hypothetical protein
MIYQHDPVDGPMVRWAGRIEAGAWIVETSEGTTAGYQSERGGCRFESSAGIVTIEVGLPVDDGLTKAQLQDILAQLGLSTSGLKVEVLERILDHLKEG